MGHLEGACAANTRVLLALAGRLGKNTDDLLRCWIKELQRVYGYWSSPEVKKRTTAVRANDHEL